MQSLSKSLFVRKGLKPTANSCTGYNRTAQIGSKKYDPNAFLKQRFSGEGIITSSEIWNSERIQKSIFRDMANFCKFYTIPYPANDHLIYPLNIKMMLEQIEKAYNSKGGEHSLAIFKHQNGKVFLATIKTFHPKYDLYHIPIAPLSYLFGKEGQTPFTDLLFSIFSYLKCELKIPYFLHDSFIHECYESTRILYEEGLEEENEETEYAYRLIDELDFIESEGEKLVAEINQTKHRDLFYARSDCFLPNDEFQFKIHIIAQNLISFRNKYPQITLSEIIPENEILDNDNYSIGPEVYIGISWGDESDLLEYNYSEYINNLFQEASQMQLPSAIQLFNKPIKKEYHNLEIQQKFFQLLEDISDVLYDCIKTHNR